MNKVVVTGIGLATPLALGREKTWHALLNGESAVRPDREHAGILSARISNLEVPPETRLLSIAFLAAAEAVEDANLNFQTIDPRRFGCTVSVSKPCLSGTGRIRFSEAFFPSIIGRQLAAVFKLGGPLQNISAACATGADAVIIAAEWVRHGYCDMALVGAVESSLHPLYLAGFRQMGVLASRAVRPFDKRREGFALGEGAGILVLERRDRALLRGAKIYGEIAGTAMANDTHTSVAFGASGENITGAIRETLRKAGTDRVDYINAHGTATPLNDVIETRAIRKAFNDDARTLVVSSTKAATGHLLGASGAVEIALCLLALRDNVVPPTLNLTELDPECDLDYVPGGARRMRLETALSLSFGFGGQIGVVAVRR